MTETQAPSPVTDSLNSIAEVMARAMQAVEQLTIEHGGDAVDLALMVARVDAIQDCFTSFGAILVMIGLFVVGLKSQRKANWNELHCVYAYTCIISYAVSAFVALLTAMTGYMFNLTHWIGAVYPEYWLAMKAMNGVL